MAGETGSAPADVAALKLIQELRATLREREALIEELQELQELLERAEKSD